MATQFLGRGNNTATATMYLFVIACYLKPLGIHIWHTCQTLNQQLLSFPLTSKKHITTYNENTSLVTKVFLGSKL